jgi:heparin binding hemagglutinin HbhA
MSSKTTASFDTVAKPLYAGVGAADKLYQSVLGAITTERVEKVREQIAKVPADVQEQIQTLRERIAKLPEVPEEFTELRSKLTPEELRKAADGYRTKAGDLYTELADHGEQTVERLRSDERLGKVEGIYREALGLAEEAFTKVSEQAKVVVDLVAGKATEASEKVEEATDSE